VPDPTVISIDAMGGDFGPPVIVAGLAAETEAWRARNLRFTVTRLGSNPSWCGIQAPEH
jgi:fatty acid/phospholipid biosynthesis enzyme